MVFFFGCLVVSWFGRHIGWKISRNFLYLPGWAVCLAFCLAWSVGLAYVLRLAILATSPGLILKAFGYFAGAYESIPNFQLLDESRLELRPQLFIRHVFIETVTLVLYVAASVLLAFALPMTRHG